MYGITELYLNVEFDSSHHQFEIFSGINYVHKVYYM